MEDQNEMDHDGEKTADGEMVRNSSLPSRRDYHRGQSKKRRKKDKNPFLLARILLAAFIILVVIVLAYSITNHYLL